MAGVRTLLALSRRSDRRTSETTRSGAEKLVTLCVGIGASFALLQQVKAIALGPPSLRLKTGRVVVLVLCVLWTLIPLSIRPAITVQAIKLYPLTTSEKLVFHLLSYLQNRVMLALVGASLLVSIALTRVPDSLSHSATLVTSLVVTVLVGLLLATMLQPSLARTSSPRLSQRIPTSKLFPLVRKELRYFARTLDLYLALMISVGAGYSEYVAAWMTPAKAMVPMLLVAFVQLPAVLNPFGLDRPRELERYRLLPIPAWRILLDKHLALTVLFLLASLPLAASLFYRLPIRESLICAVLMMVVWLSWICTGLLLMRSPAARTVSMAFEKLSGDGMSILLALQAGGLVCFLPIVLCVLSLEVRASGLAVGLFLAFALLTFVYGRSIRSGNQTP